MLQVGKNGEPCMLTIFACPKGFDDKHIRIIQRNAIRSWLLLKPRPEVFLFGDANGVAGTCAEFGIVHVPHVETNEFGTPLLNDVFRKVESLARGKLFCYINADIMLPTDFYETVTAVAGRKRRFLMGGRPWNLDVEEELTFEDGWQRSLIDRALKEGELRSPRSCDFFVYPRGLWGHLPPFALGRSYFDNALLYRARQAGAALVDATQAVVAIHQNHSSPSHLSGSQYLENPEAKRNKMLAEGPRRLFTWKNATHVFKEGQPRFHLLGYLRVFGPESPVSLFIYRWLLNPIRAIHSMGQEMLQGRKV
jgi:hypothetical protein